MTRRVCDELTGDQLTGSLWNYPGKTADTINGKPNDLQDCETTGVTGSAARQRRNREEIVFRKDRSNHIKPRSDSSTEHFISLLTELQFWSSSEAD